MIYLMLSALFFLLGFRWKTYNYFFALAVLCCPLSNTYAEWVYKSGLFVYDYYFFSMCGSIVFSRHALSWVKENLDFTKIILCCMLIFSMIMGVLNNIDSGILYLLRDMRLVLFVVWLALLVIAFDELRVSKTKILFLFFISSVSSLTYFLLNYLGFVSVSDSFYTDNSERYSDAGTYAAIVFLIFMRGSQYKSVRLMYYMTLIASCVCVLVSGSRMYLFALLAAFFITQLSNLSRNQIVASLLVLSIAIAALFFDFDYGRFENIDIATLSHHFSIRFSPFIDAFDGTSVVKYIFGSGLGATFYIPWFEYRESKDVYSNSIDSTYLTLYYKLGVFMLVYLYVFCRQLVLGFSSLHRLVVLVLLVLLMLVVCVPMQINAIGLILSLIVVSKVIYREST